MGINSREEILKQMAGQSVTFGWGAVTVFNKTRLNRLLEQQYVSRMEGNSFFPGFAGEISLSSSSNATVKLDSVVLGKPLLSFEQAASLDESMATVTLNIVSGNLLLMQPGEKAARVNTSLKIRESHGYQVTMRLQLSMITGSVSELGVVMMDLSKGVDFSCNLLPDALDQVPLGTGFKDFFNSLPETQRVFVLGVLDMGSYDPLAPKEFSILTQRAPGADNLTASNYGDGGVVVFVCVAADTEIGNLPREGSGFPYLIPDDQDELGQDIYSAAVVVTQKWSDYVNDKSIEQLSNLLVPGADSFLSKDSAEPFDYINFGNVNPSATQLVIHPLLSTLKVGQTQAFSVKRSDGTAVSGVTWTAKSLNSHTLKGDGAINSDGIYTAMGVDDIEADTARVVITGTVILDDVFYKVSAAVMVTAERMVIAPQVSSRIIELTPKTVTLFAATSATSKLTWSLSLPLVGELEVLGSGNTAIYTPPTAEQATFETVQVISVYDETLKETAQSTVVLFNNYLSLGVSPAHTSHLTRGKTVTFAVEDDFPADTTTWSVIRGGGAFENPQSGIFTAPDPVVDPVTLVKCVKTSGIFTFTGYSTIEFDKFEEGPGWTKLAKFTVKVRDSSGNLGPTGYVYRNGLQQVKLAVSIETTVLNNNPQRPSSLELQSLRLVTSGGAQVNPLPPGQVGISPGVGAWATTTIANAYHLFPGAGVPALGLASAEPLSEQSTANFELYVQTTMPAKENGTFHLSFVGGNNEETFYSNTSDAINGQVNLTPVDPPRLIVNKDYTFDKIMISDGTLKTGITKAINQHEQLEPEPGDYYDFHLNTIDYYELKFVNCKMARLSFLPTATGFGHKSTVRWESRLLEETMFSFSGYAWNPAKLTDVESGEEKSSNIYVDPWMKNIMLTQTVPTFPLEKAIAEGDFIVSMHRTDDVRYGALVAQEDIVARDRLYSDINIAFVDQYGNTYKCVVGFPAESIHDRQNMELKFL